MDFVALIVSQQECVDVEANESPEFPYSGARGAPGVRGGDRHALWDDIKFSTTHCTKIERIAMVGDKKWEARMAKVCKPFTMAKVKYFDVSEVDAAWAWLQEA